jgi:hypothetical protein
MRAASTSWREVAMKSNDAKRPDAACDTALRDGRPDLNTCRNLVLFFTAFESVRQFSKLYGT